VSDARLATSVRLQPGRIARRVTDHQTIPFPYDEDAVRLSVSRCTAVESGGRMTATTLTHTVLPVVNREFLARTMTGSAVNCVRLAVASGDFGYQLE